MPKDRRKGSRLSIADVNAIIRNMNIDAKLNFMRPLRGRYHTFEEVLAFFAEHMCLFINDGTRISAISVSREKIERPKRAA